jgi:DNA-directed RNA polymerase subunit RPC12/RpoP
MPYCSCWETLHVKTDNEGKPIRGGDGRFIRIPEYSHTEMRKEPFKIHGLEVYTCPHCGAVQLVKNPTSDEERIMKMVKKDET